MHSALTLKFPTLFSRFRYSMETVCKSFKKVLKNLLLCIDIKLTLVTIHWLTHFSKFLLINLRNQLWKNTFFQGWSRVNGISNWKTYASQNARLEITQISNKFVALLSTCLSTALYRPSYVMSSIFVILVLIIIFRQQRKPKNGEKMLFKLLWLWLSDILFFVHHINTGVNNPVIFSSWCKITKKL